MADFILFMHDDAPGEASGEDWAAYLAGLRASGAFDGGSAIGDGACFRKDGSAPAITQHLGGFLRVRADDLARARAFLAGNPAYEAGGTVEIRELPKT